MNESEIEKDIMANADPMIDCVKPAQVSQPMPDHIREAQIVLNDYLIRTGSSSVQVSQPETVHTKFSVGDFVVGLGENEGCSQVFEDCGHLQPFSYLSDFNPENYRLATNDEIFQAGIKCASRPENYDDQVSQEPVSPSLNRIDNDDAEEGIRYLIANRKETEGDAIGTLIFELKDENRALRLCIAELEEERMLLKSDIEGWHDHYADKQKALVAKRDKLQADAARWDYVMQTTTAIHDKSERLSCTPDEYKAAVDLAMEKEK